MLEIILGVDGVDVEAQNEHGFTALDVLARSRWERGDNEIVKILEKAGCKRATEGSERNEDGLKQMSKNLLIAATLIAAVTFSAGYSPPGGVWSGPSEVPTASAKDPQAGTAIFAKKFGFTAFLSLNAIAFMGSCGIILSLVSCVPFPRIRDHITTLYLTRAVNGTIWSLMLAFLLGAYLVSSPSPRDVYAMYAAFVPLALVVNIPLILDGPIYDVVKRSITWITGKRDNQ